MLGRRTFIKSSIVAASILALGKSVPAYAEGSSFSGVVYTKDNPGKWGKKVGSHLPAMMLDGGSVTLKTKHPMSPAHYIIRHTLVLADGTVVGGKTFSPTDAKAVSTYQLPAGYTGRIYATSFCNLHDFWVNEIVV